MKSLQAAFESELRITVDDDGNASIGDTPISAVDVLRGDEDAYETEFERWQEQVWIPREEARLNDLLGIHGNRQRFADLCRGIGREHVVPLIGSGMSVPFGLPVWRAFMVGLSGYAKIDTPIIEGLMNGGQFEEAATRLRDSMPARLFDERIDHELREDISRTADTPCHLLPLVFSGKVLTTNLDRSLEKIYDLNETPFSAVLSGTGIADYRRTAGETDCHLLKLHGDRETIQSRVLGSVEYSASYGPGGGLRDELTLIYRTHSILFMGASLTADRTLALLSEVALADANMPKHFAFCPLPEDNALRLEREHFLTDSGVFPIWYDGDHSEDIRALLFGLGRHIGKF